MIVQRTVCLIDPDVNPYFRQESLSLRDFRVAHGYVLIGESGIGKSTEFQEEAKQVGALQPIPARRFLKCNLKDHPQWEKGPLFIDGLDEVRVHAGNPRLVIDQLIKRLKALGTPQFRISCRSGSWLGAKEVEELASLSSDPHISVLKLDPLRSTDVKHIISEHEKEADEFIRQAHEYRMDPLLFNPQLLEFLLNSVATGKWPKTPKDLLEKACYERIRERNPKPLIDHSLESVITDSSVLNAAGELCTIMLVGHKIGWAINDIDHPETFSLRRLDTPDTDAHLAALNSSFFQGSSSYRTPVNRRLAEYIGARYLASKIHDGLSVRRTLTLLSGSDGDLFPDLRGLTAWLAVLSPKVRSALINADPIALAIEGDTSDFSSEEREKSLKKLAKNNHSANIWPVALSLGVLAQEQGMSYVSEYTKSLERSGSRQILVTFLLKSISYTHSHFAKNDQHAFQAHLETHSQTLLAIIRDSSWNSNVRCTAIYALCNIVPEKSHLNQFLGVLLNDFNENHLSDENGGLRGVLLDCLYPGQLQPSDIWDYLPDFLVKPFVSYQKFFLGLAAKSEKRHVKELLDSLYVRASEIIPRLDQHQLADVPVILLSRGLALCDNKLDIAEIYRWFELVEFDKNHSALIPKYCSANSLSSEGWKANMSIRNWLNEHPLMQYKLIEYGLQRNESEIGNTPLQVTVGLKFVDENAQKGFRSWCLTHAVEIFNSYPKLAEELAQWSTEPVGAWEPPLSDDKVAQIISGTDGLCKWNEKRLERKKKRKREGGKQQDEWGNFQEFRIKKDNTQDIVYIHKHITELSEGRCRSDILDKLARLYFQSHNEVFGDTLTHLESYLDRDPELLEATLSGFRNLLKWDDLPDLNQIAGQYEKGERSLYARPFLAGMEEEGKSAFSALSKTGKRRALGFLFVTDLPVPKKSHSNHPFILWYEEALQQYPDLVADAMVSVHRACVRSKKRLPNAYLLEMSFEEVYAEVASLAVFKMITVFPTRCNGLQLKSLSTVLWSALTHGLTKKELQRIVLERLNRKNMDTGQRAQWLCTGLVVARDHCLPLVVDFLSDKGGAKAHYIFDFLLPERLNTIFEDFRSWSTKDLAQLLQAFGKWIVPLTIHDDSYTPNHYEIKSEQFGAVLMKGLSKMAESTDNDSRKELAGLVSHPELAAWNRKILRAQEKQTLRYRAENHRDLNPIQIQSILRSSYPSSAADLAALTVELLEELGSRIRNRQANDWRYYWYQDGKKGTPLKPLHEDHCRDIFLADLLMMLKKYGADTQPEGSYANERRANIRVSYGKHHSVPIEIKHNNHRKIWSAINEQLVSKYMRDPDCNGFGIYLVFWFGPEYMRVPLASGCIPEQPEEVKKLLLRQIDPKAKNHVFVIVVDVSPQVM